MPKPDKFAPKAFDGSNVSGVLLGRVPVNGLGSSWGAFVLGGSFGVVTGMLAVTEGLVAWEVGGTAVLDVTVTGVAGAAKPPEDFGGPGNQEVTRG